MFIQKNLTNLFYQIKESHALILNRWCRLCVLTWLITFAIFISFIDCSKKLSPTEPEWPPATEEVNGTLTDIEGISVLRIWGSPFEKGYAHGYLLAEDIVTMMENFIGNGIFGMDAETWRNQVIPAIGMFTIEQRFEDELQGMLAGIEARAGREVNIPPLGRTLQYADLAAINIGPDFFGVTCSSFSGWGSMTTDGNTITGRNFDWTEIPGVFEKQYVIADVATAGSGLLGFVTVNWPGIIGCFTVMNSEGVTLNINNTNGYSPTQTSGFHPRIFIYREAIESAHAGTALNDVENVLKSRMTSTPQNLMVTVPHNDGNACSVAFEYDGNRSIDNGVTVRGPEESKCYQICTNHCRERKPPIYCWRYSQLSVQLESIATSGGANYLTQEKAWELLEGVAQGNGTHHRVIFEPNKKLMHVALSVVVPAPQYNAVTLSVSALLDGTFGYRRCFIPSVIDLDEESLPGFI